jgi:high-affinity K+ transport system ATPase subunit B
MIITVTLAAGAKRMAKGKVIVKRLQVIENLGTMDVLCSDKTGTLTLGSRSHCRPVSISMASNPHRTCSLATSWPHPRQLLRLMHRAAGGTATAGLVARRLCRSTS